MGFELLNKDVFQASIARALFVPEAVHLGHVLLKVLWWLGDWEALS